MSVETVLQHAAPMKAGNLGWIIRGDSHADGSMVCGGDTAISARKELTGAEWDILSSTAKIAGFTPGANHEAIKGCYDIKIAPSDSNYIYFSFGGRFFRSTDRGVTVVERNSATLNSPKSPDMSSNEFSIKAPQKRFDVDPSDRNHIIFGCERNGVFESNDGGANWTATTLPLPNAGFYVNGNGYSCGATCIMFDPYSVVQGGQRSVCWAHIGGRGLYRRDTTVSATWVKMTGDPGTATFLGMDCDIDTDGTIYIIIANDINPSVAQTTQIYKATRSGTAMSSYYAPAGKNPNSVAVNPGNKNHILVLIGYGHETHETNTASTATNSTGWTIRTTDTRNVPNQPSHDGTYTKNNGGAVTAMKFHKNNTNTIICFDGLGFYKGIRNPASITDPLVLTGDSVGLQQLVMRQIIAEPTGVVRATWWDQVGAVIRTPSGSASPYRELPTMIDMGTAPHLITDGMYISPYPGNANRFAMSVGRNVPGSSRRAMYTLDGTTMVPVNSAGHQLLRRAVADGGSNEYADGGSAFLVGTTTLGFLHIPRIGRPARNADIVGTPNTWVAMTFPGVTDAVTSPGYTGFYLNYDFSPNRLSFAQDTVDPNVIFGVHATAGHYRTGDGGANWVRMRTTNIISDNGGDANFNVRIKAIPGETNSYMFVSGGSAGEGSASGIYYTSNGGTSFAQIGQSDGVREIVDLGFGKAAPGSTRPALFFVGIANGVFGHYRCDNWYEASPKFTMFAPRYFSTSLDATSCIEGDPLNYKACFIGKAGAGLWHSNGGAPTELSILRSAA